jgi:hypothetical protein
MIYAIQSNGRTVALTDDASAIHKINTHGSLTTPLGERVSITARTPLVAGTETED